MANYPWTMQVKKGLSGAQAMEITTRQRFDPSVRYKTRDFICEIICRSPANAAQSRPSVWDYSRPPWTIMIMEGVNALL